MFVGHRERLADQTAELTPEHQVRPKLFDPSELLDDASVIRAGRLRQLVLDHRGHQHKHPAQLHAMIDHPHPIVLPIGFPQDRDAVSATPVSHGVSR
ncbi:MAG: hypothetical protein KDA47_15275, partial [Planctomycetales bacterium]|nr:hypothetical protein [Planctomycetales bacterium]